ncbi:MAG: SGNH/GDSL hydrolase family protein, partial [Bacteroidaceae bacterium]|nr:SGNH/GDSL hydrolase family protein [Bacteroidaceae bacterium]
MRIRIFLLVCLICMSAQAKRRSISVLGDSYSTYEYCVTPVTNRVWYHEPFLAEKTDVSDVTQTWWHLLCQKRGFKLDTNNSYSGATICNTGYDGNDYTDRSFITRASNLGCPDIILVFGGTNDSWANSPLGEMKHEGYTSQDLFSFRPAVSYLARYLT